MIDLETLSWPLSRLGEMIEVVCRKRGLSVQAGKVPTFPEDLERIGEDAVDCWIDSASRLLGVEAEPVEIHYAGAESFLRAAGPGLLRLPGAREPRFLALLGARRRVVLLLGPDRAVHRIRTQVVLRALCQPLEAPLIGEVERLLQSAGVSGRHQARARATMLRERLRAARIGACWVLRPSPGASFWDQLRLARLPRFFLSLSGAHAAQYLLWLLSWWVIGKGALEGRLDAGWLIAWTLLLFTLVPFRLLETWLEGRIAIAAGGLLKQRLLFGAMRLDPEEIRRQGAGQLLGRVMESDAVESLALSGGLLAVLAGIELSVAAMVLAVGAGGAVQAFLLVGWVVLTLLIGRRYLRQRSHWTEARFAMTNDVVERMLGHRTQLAQEVPEHWHDEEDETLERYLGLSAIMDRTSSLLVALVPRGWLFLGLIGLAPAFVSGRSAAALAVSLGGMLLGYGAFQKLAAGLSHLADAAISWKQVAPFFHAASRPQVTGSPIFARMDDLAFADDARPILEARGLIFRYGNRSEPILEGVNIRVSRRERILLEGPSGGGKSTLASLLVGLREPDSGLLLFGGVDRQTLGSENWRRLVVAAPQFHENHVLTESFAFNLLMGRRWPAQEEDFEEAEAVCRELGLGDLLSRMPAGLLQMVGETGWQLSHGERSRLYIARALLQRACVIVLDESFAALDPETLRRCLYCVFERAPALFVIAHP